MSARAARPSEVVERTDQHSDVTTTDGGGSSGDWSEILDLSPGRDVEYIVFDGMRIAFDPDSSSPADLPDNAQIKFVVEGVTEEDQRQIGSAVSLREFNSKTDAEQFNEDFEFNLNVPRRRITVEADRHFKIYLDSGTAISWSDSWINFEVGRRTL